jgi:hypothetical protein
MTLHWSPGLRMPYGFGGVGQPYIVIDCLLHAFYAVWGDGAYPRVKDHDRDNLYLGEDSPVVDGGGQPTQMFEGTHDAVLQRGILVERVKPFAHGDAK